MNKNLNLRLRRVATKLNLVTRLRQAAFSEDEMIGRASNKSKKMLTDIQHNFVRVHQDILPSLSPGGREAIEQAKQDPRYKDRLYKTLEQFAASVAPIRSALDKAKSAISAPEKATEKAASARRKLIARLSKETSPKGAR